MVSPADPNEVRLTGENSFIRLHPDENGPQTTRASHWRALLSPAGPGHVLFLKSDVTEDQVRVYSDNIALARWLQEEIESSLFPEFSDQSIPVVDALFAKSGDGRSFWMETVESEEDSVSLTWYDFMAPWLNRVAPGSVPGRVHGVSCCFIPARRAQLTLNGMVANGTPTQEKRGDQDTTSACLAWSETWIRPY